MNWREQLKWRRPPRLAPARGFADDLGSDPFAAIPQGDRRTEAIAQCVAMRFARGNVFGQTRPLLTKEEIEARLEKALNIDWSSD